MDAKKNKGLKRFFRNMCAFKDLKCLSRYSFRYDIPPLKIDSPYDSKDLHNSTVIT